MKISPTPARALATAAVVASALVVSGCAGSDPLTPGSSAGKGTITVASANFPENVILGEIYAQALEGAGYTVTRNLNIGAREVYYSQVQSCSLSVVPEYNQALLAFVAPDVTATGTEEVDAALAEALPSGVSVLDSSAAEDNNAVVVTRTTAEQNGLTSIGDMAEISPSWVFGGPPEWAERKDGMAGLEKAYGLDFGEYRVLDYSGPITISALDKGDIQAALLFSTVPQIVENDYVVLDDPEKVLGVNNVIPLICDEAIDDGARKILDAISAQLTTAQLAKLNSAYSTDKQDVDVVARDWIESADLP